MIVFVVQNPPDRQDGRMAPGVHKLFQVRGFQGTGFQGQTLRLTNKLEMRTLSAGISMLYLGEQSQDWARVMAAATSASLPILIVYIFLQKYMIEGLAMGAVKE